MIQLLAALWAGALLCLAPALAQGDEVLGRLETAPKSFLAETPFVSQCELGGAAADALRAWAGADIALVNVGDLQNDLNAGEVTRADVQRVFREDKALAAAEIAPAELFSILEHSVAQVTVDPATEQIMAEDSVFEGFCQIAGFRFQYDASAPAGQRVLSVTLDDGRKLSADDRETRLRLCASAYMLRGGYGYPAFSCEELEGSLSQVLGAWVSRNSDLSAQGRERIQVLGARQNTIAGLLPRGVWVAGALVFIGLVALQGLKLKNYRREFEADPDMENPYKDPRNR